MKTAKAISVILLLTLTAAGAIASIVYLIGSLKPGLDFHGGLRVLLKASADVPESDIDTTVSIIKRRLEGVGIIEPVVYNDERNSIIAELPESSLNSDIADLISRRAYLSFGVFDNNGDILLILDSGHVTGARYTRQALKGAEGEVGHFVSVYFNDYGRGVLADATRGLITTYPALTFEEAKRTGDLRRNIAILLDGSMIACPYVSVPITTGEAVLSSFTPEQARRLELIVNTGAFPAELTLLDSSRTGPALGSEAIASGAYSGLAGLILCALLGAMIYRTPGLIGIGAACLSAAVTLAVLVLFDITMTISAAIGIALSVALCLDYQVAINDRIAGELASGKAVILAARDGFAGAAKSIAGGGASLALAAMVLSFFSVGSVRGFSFSFCAGMFSNLLVTIVYTGLMYLIMARSGLLDIPAVSGRKAAGR